MKRHLLCSAAIATLISGGSADAADSFWAAGPYNWNGFYAGVVAGAAWGQYDPFTSTVAGGYLNSTQAAAVTAAGTQTIKQNGFVSGIEGGYDWRSGNFLVGIEADMEAVHLNGATNSGAVPYPGAAPYAFTITSYGNADWLLTARPRIGFITPNNWLLYATGGLAVTQLQTDFSFIDNVGVEEAGRVNTLKTGYAIGGGVEAPLSNKLSVKADYLHVGFSNTTGTSTTNNLLVFFPAQVFTHSSDLKADLFRVGLNYNFGGPDLPASGGSILPLKAPPVLRPVSSNWDVEAGARIWLSSGKVGAPDPLFNNPPPTMPVVSRLVYSGLDALSGESFARVDHTSGFFVKGYLGAGGVTAGSLNDEDFPAGNAYSNTLSNANGHIGYGTIDLGYNLLKTPGAEVGAFIGYNYYEQGINTYGCTQIAAANGSCPLAPGLPSALLGLTEYDHLNSLRVGLASEMMLTDRLKLTADAAYVPLTTFGGLDDHLLRQLLLPESSNSGNGVMLEAVLGYNITDAWSVGIGGRYWAWNLHIGTETFEFLAPPSSFPEPARFNAERYGAFVQTSYRWGNASPAAAASPMPTKAPVLAAGPMNWSGFYLGGHLGGGFSDARWSDPFPTAPSGLGGINIAGFGDKTHATGPLAGGQIGADWQTGQWVLGAQFDASGTDLRGENTCFSGIGGIDCQHVVNALATLTGRAGFAWDRSLAYVKGGGAWTDTTYNLAGNTNALALGTGSTEQTRSGWTVGTGIEYALTNHWSTFVEYDHVGLRSTTAPFPTVAVISAANIGVTQSVDLFKMGVNYKFDFGK